MVDQDAGTFTLWQANPSTSVDLAVVTREQTGSTCSENSSPVQSSSSPSTSSSPLGGANKSTLSGGAIAGVVVGALAILAAITLLAFFLSRRKRRPAVSAQQRIGPYEMQGNSSREMRLAMATSDGGIIVHNPPHAGFEAGQDNKVSNAPSTVYEMDGLGRSSLPR